MTYTLGVVGSLRNKTARTEALRALKQQEEQKRAAAEAPSKAAAQRVAVLEARIAGKERRIVQQEVFVKPSKYLNEVCTRYNKNLTVAEVTAAVGNAVSSLKLFLDRTQGIEITTAGLAKLGRVVEVNGELDVTSVDNLKKIWGYLQENRVLTDSDFRVVRNVAPPAPEVEAPSVRKPTDIAAELASQETVTREGAKRGRALAVEQIVAEAQPIFNEFVQYVERHFDITVTDEQKKACLNYALRNNFNLLSRQTWEKARINVLKCLTPEEVKDREMVEDSNTLTSREFAKKYNLTTQGY